MKKLLSLFFPLSFMIGLSCCKKYPEGGFVNQTRKHLFGGNKVGDSKTWKLKRYEVNGIDSTYLIQGANSIPDFYDKFVTFTYEGKDPSLKFIANTSIYEYRGVIDNVYKQLTLVINHTPFTKEDSLQCKSVDGKLYCSRNILFPELGGKKSLWDIEKLTKKEFVISITSSNYYKIIFSQ